MSSETQITGFFADDAACARGIRALRKNGVSILRAFSPHVSEKMLEALHKRRSPVRLWVLLGGMTGCASGFALTIGLSLTYPHITNGMPIVSIPPYVIIAFELTILFGGLSGLLGFLLHGGFPQIDEIPGYAERFSNDRFGVLVAAPADQQSRVESLLREAGAVEVSSAAP